MGSLEERNKELTRTFLAGVTEYVTPSSKYVSSASLYASVSFKSCSPSTGVSFT